ncbi:glycosyltransferase family 2 protein [Photobacterium leiognathi]|uniref:glycosyltransferase family 2 protein n=1 Tax=Photobacterium leiognathi TaxID=553611 RepID=UPI002982777D|nr:glycosyltransferase family 2 protein [Photobacterium leiognathi]
MPSISVIVPTYNSSTTIVETINSVYKQCFLGRIQLVIVDDCSADILTLEEKITTSQPPSNVEIKFIKLRNNMGGGSARNTGIQASNCDYLTFLDSDDIWMQHKLTCQLRSYKDGTILTSQVMKGANFDNSKVLPLEVKQSNEKVSDALFVNNKLIQTSTFFMSSDIAKSIMFNPKLPRHQDYDFLLRAESLGYPVIQTEEPTSFWRVENCSSNRFLKKKATPEFFIEWYKEYKKYMTNRANIAYVAKNIFSACIITKKFGLFFKFLLSENFSYSERIKIVKAILLWRWEKLKNE